MKTFITDARLVDGSGAEPLENAVIVLDGKKIIQVETQGNIQIDQNDAHVISAAGRTVLPGLIDTHVGFMREVMPIQPNPYQTTDKFVAESILNALVNADRCLKAGVTTVRQDSAGHEGIYALREAFEAGRLDGPRIITPGNGLTISGGHAWYSCQEVDGPEEVRKAARLQLRAGADWIKLMATAGSGGLFAGESPEQWQMTVDEMRPAVEEAHKKGKWVMAHVSCAEGARNCLEAGVDSIEHGLFLEEDIVQEMADKGVFLVPTLWLYRRLVEIGERGEIPEWKYQRARGVVGRHTRSFELALEAGVKIAAGTDAGMPYTPVGASLHNEMLVMHEIGMSPMDVIVSATRRAAECLRLDDELGTIQPGKLADILIVDGDPLSNLGDTRQTWKVFKEGKLVHSRAN